MSLECNKMSTRGASMLSGLDEPGDLPEGSPPLKPLKPNARRKFGPSVSKGQMKIAWRFNSTPGQRRGHRPVPFRT